jgi:hypothetical protein
MADFRLREDADEFFRHLKDQSPFRSMWDFYHLCSMLGVFGQRSSDPSEEDIAAPVFVQHVIDDYKPTELIVVALILLAQMAKVGYRVEDRKAVQRLLTQLINPRAPGLGPEGVTLLNRYASGGFDLLVERYGDVAPRTPEEFLPRYAKLLDEVIQGADHIFV